MTILKNSNRKLTLIPPITNRVFAMTDTENHAKLSTGIEGQVCHTVLDGENDCIQFKMHVLRPPKTTNVGCFSVARRAGKLLTYIDGLSSPL